MFYRQEIDGLRAIALLPVIFYHAGFMLLFSGGYVGVDIFFVISGYLITSLIDVEIQQNTFSLIRFYERRCRRILPALYVILLISCCFAYYLMSPSRLEEFGYTLISIITFCSNIFFWWKDDKYFSRISELNPLVHTWSLAVEEQFYLVFPLLCYLFAKRRHYLIVLLGFLSIFSFFLAQWGGNFVSSPNPTFYWFLQHPLATFYLPIGRIWELLMGSFVAFYLRNNNSIEHVENNVCISRFVSQILSLLGLWLILTSIFLLDSRIIPPFPNCYTLMPTSGAALILMFANQNTLVGRLLSTQLLRWIGLISYSGYLWHQPLLVFIRLQSITLSTIESIVLIGIVLLLAAFTYFFIEQPFRNRTLFSRKQIFCISSAGALIIFLIASSLLIHANNAPVSTKVNNTTIISNESRYLIIEEEDTYLKDIDPFELSDYTTRLFDGHMRKYPTFSDASKSTNRRLLLIGDSFAQEFMNMAMETKSLLDYEIRCYYVRCYCQIYIGAEDRLQWIAPGHRGMCINDNDVRSALPMIRQANVIILAGAWKNWSAERLPKTIEAFNLTKDQKLLVLGAKNFGQISLPSYKNKSFAYRTGLFQQPDEEFLYINAIMKQTLHKSIFIDALNMICTYPNMTCPIFTRNGKIITYDGWHLTKHGARYVGNILFKNYPLNQL